MGADTFEIVSLQSISAFVDLLTDFTPGSDRLAFYGTSAETLGFYNPAANIPLSAELLAIGSTATTAAQRLIYDPANGLLSYDADGSDSGAAIAIMQIGILNHPQLAAADFVILA